jgi:hypothetical protein
MAVRTLRDGIAKLWSTEPLFVIANVTSPEVTTLGLKLALNSVSVTCTTDDPDALSAVEPPFIATTATTPKTSADTATAIIIMPSMDFANIDSLTLLFSGDSVDMFTSVGTPKRYALWLSGKQLSVLAVEQKNQQSMELFGDVTKSERARCVQLENT